MVNLSRVTVFFLSLLLGKAAAEDFSVPEACTEQVDSLFECMLALPDRGASCVDCYSASIPADAASCSDAETKFCAAFASCDCGSCSSESIATLNCVIDDTLVGADCQIDCSNAGNPDSGNPGTGAGTSGSSSERLVSAFLLAAGMIAALTL